MQIFHTVVNKVHVDYASLLWSDFLHCVMQKKNVIEYPRFTKLIIANLIEKYKSIPKRLEEEYHTIKQKKFTPTTPLPPSDDQERDDIVEATQLSFALEKMAKVYAEQQNVAAVEKKILEEDVDKLVEGEDESDGDEFAYTVLLSDEDSGDRIEPESHKDKPKENVGDEKKDEDDKHDDAKDDDDDHNDQSLIRFGGRETAEELMVSDTPIPDATTQYQQKPTSRRCTHIPGADIIKKMNESLKEIVPKIATSTTNDLINDNLPKLVTDAIKKERESSQPMKSNLHSQVTDPEPGMHLRPNMKSLLPLLTLPVWKSRQEDLKHSQSDALAFYGPHRNLNEPPRYLYNKDLLFLKNGSTKEKRYVLSLHKIHATTFPEEDLEEKMI
ncbi:hypothetical protein Tco_1243695 [Tanacetum coccineum]